MKRRIKSDAYRGRSWAYTGAFLGGGISIAANIAHSFVPPVGAQADWRPQPGAVIGSMFWPILLFVAVEILARVRWPSGDRWYKTLGWAFLRFGGMLPVAGVAFLVSFRHMSALLAYYGEDEIVSFWGPVAIDGLMVMAAAALLAMGRTASQQPHVPDLEAVPATMVHQTEQPPNTTRRDLVPVQVPTHLIQPARFAVTNHEQIHGRPISPEELSSAINIPVTTAGQLLTALNHQASVEMAPVLNGTPIGDDR